MVQWRRIRNIGLGNPELVNYEISRAKVLEVFEWFCRNKGQSTTMQSLTQRLFDNFEQEKKDPIVDTRSLLTALDFACLHEGRQKDVAMACVPVILDAIARCEPPVSASLVAQLRKFFPRRIT